MNKKIFILGGSSFIGRHLFVRLGCDKAIATYFRNPIENGVYFDSVAMDLPEIIKSPEEISCAIILLGDTDPETCAADVKRSQSLNVESIKSILDYLKKWHLRPIFASSEFVFDGIKGNYVETDPVNPILIYGKQKAEIEKYLQNNFDKFVILRLAKVYGSELGDGTIFSNWIEAICRGQTNIQCANDQIFSPVYLQDVVEGFIRAAKDESLNGIFHLCGDRPYRRIHLLDILLGAVRKYRQLRLKVIPSSIHDFKLREKRPVNVSMIPDKFVRATGIKLIKAEQICKEMARNVFQV